MKKQDSKMTKKELQQAVNQMQRLRDNRQIFNSFNKHMRGAIIYRLGKYKRLLREKG